MTMENNVGQQLHSWPITLLLPPAAGEEARLSFSRQIMHKTQPRSWNQVSTAEWVCVCVCSHVRSIGQEAR